MMAGGRLLKEHREMQKDARVAGVDAEIVLAPEDGNLSHWVGHVRGPVETPYENGYFKIDVVVPSSYPLSPPNVRLLSKVFHPNVHPKTGEVCLDILKTAWSPAWTLASTARALIVLLGHPEPDSPLNCDAGNLLRAGDGRAFRSLARMYTKLCAGPPPEVVASRQR